MGVKTFILLAMFSCGLPLVSACNSSAPTGSLRSAEQNCLNAYRTYADAWNCARNQAATYDDYRQAYVANGDALLSQVNSGQVSDASARSSMASDFSGGSHSGGGRR